MQYQFIQPPLSADCGLYSDNELRFIMAQVSILPSAVLSASGLSRLAATPTPHQVSPASTIDGTSSLSLPLQLEADLRGLPSAPVALALIPFLVLMLLALRPKSRFRNWCRTSSQDFLGLFRPIRRRRHVIHDQPYLDRVLLAEFGGHRPPSASLQFSSTRSSTEPPAKDDSLPPSPDEGRDLPS
jgi:hypothetical protein